MNSGTLTVTQAATCVSEITGAKKPHRSVIRRWIAKGVRGTKLKATRVGNLYCIQRVDLINFLQAPSATQSKPSNATMALGAMLGRQYG